MKFEKQTYTQVPNSLFAIMKDMDECELKVVMLICRYTFGYHREEVKLSTRRIADEIGMNTASVQKGADAAVERGLIEKVIDGNKTTLWRAVVGDSENESLVIQNLTRDDSENESLSSIKESNKENIKSPLTFEENQQANAKVDAILAMRDAPGIKREAKIDAILSYIGGRLQINTETKRWKSFAKFAYDKHLEGQQIETFIGWVMGQKNFDVQFWPPQKMQEMWPQAFVEQVQQPEREEGKGFYA